MVALAGTLCRAMWMASASSSRSSGLPTRETGGCASSCLADVEKYTVYKGSICIEGISLTVAKLEDGVCTVAIIPHTVEMTNLKSLKPGDPVNLEADLIAKYVEKMMSGEPAESALTVEELVRQGILKAVPVISGQ